MTDAERSKPENINSNWQPFHTAPLHFKGRKETRQPVNLQERNGQSLLGVGVYSPEGFRRLGDAGRITQERTVIRAIRYFDDFPLQELTVNWTDTGPELSKSYVVQTNPKTIQRCLLMTTDPGDLVLDPTCGSGTTAYVAESWGRRWITIDTSRVAVALARQRLLTGNFDYYKLKDESEGIGGGFVNKTVPHITLRSIAQNTALDPIFAKYEPILKEKLETLNNALTEVTLEMRTKPAFQTC